MSTQLIGCDKGSYVNIFDVKAVFVSSHNSNTDCEHLSADSYSRTKNPNQLNGLCKYDTELSVCELTYDSYKSLFISNQDANNDGVPIRYEVFYSCNCK